MNAIDNALQEIEFTIPAPIRQFAFIKLNPASCFTSLSESAIIRQDVIYKKVLPDCNWVGGTQILIPLRDVPYQRLPTGERVFQIPPNLLQGRHILTTQSIAVGDRTSNLHSNAMSVTDTSPLSNALGAVADAAAPHCGYVTNRVRPVGKNVVLLEEDFHTDDLYLRCTLTNDAQLSNFSPRIYPIFAQLCTLAVKAHIYNTCSLQIDAGQLMGGVTVGRFREIVDSYSDAYQQYRELLRDTFTKVSFQQDRESHDRHLRMLVGRPGL